MDGGEAVSLTRWQHFTPTGRFLALIFVRGSVNLWAMMGLEGLGELRGQIVELEQKQNKLRGPNPRANYTDRATAACWRSQCQLLRIEGATWSA
jgi:hypothetical protein